MTLRTTMLAEAKRLERQRHETSSSSISAFGSGRCGAAGHLTHCTSATLSHSPYPASDSLSAGWRIRLRRSPVGREDETFEIGRASCRERVEMSVGSVEVKRKKGQITGDEI